LKLYIDSNAFVSLYANDNPDHAVMTKQAIGQAKTTASSLITYAEVRAAFRSLRHNKRITQKEFVQAIKDFERDWQMVERLVVNESLALLAGAIADIHVFKGCDAVHVATAVTLHSLSGDLQFLTFDTQLEKRVLASGLVPLWIA
jgi:predicted nucleic acid-binding protein